jgi:hypothetical protein
MTRSRALLAPLALLGLLGCGGPLFSAEVVVDRFCLTQHLANLPLLPPVAGSVTVPPVSVPLQLPPGLRTHGSTAIVRLEDGHLTPTTPGTTLDGIASLDLAIQPASGGLVTAARYAKAAGASNVTALPLAGQGVNVADLLQSGALQVALDIATTGQAQPSAPWDADLELCFYGKTVISYF